MADDKFINGLMFKAPNERAPDYVKAKGSIKREDLIATLQGMTGDWVNFDVKVSQNGKWYAAVDDWKPNQDNQRQSSPARQESRQAPADSSYGDAAKGGFEDAEIPFAPINRRQLW